MKPEFENTNPARIAAFEKYYAGKITFQAVAGARKAARRKDWICRIDNQRGGEFFVVHHRFINPPFNRPGFLTPGTILGMWNEVTYLEQKP